VIELEDSIAKINLGLDEYLAAKSLDVSTIRSLLLLDVDRIYSIGMYNHITGERLSVWQKLLRKYLTFDKVHEARKNESLPEEKIRIHDPIEALGLPPDDVEQLRNAGLTTVYQFLEEDLKAILTKSGAGEPAVERMLSFRENLRKKEEKKDMRRVTEPGRKKRKRKTIQVQPTVTAEEFIEMPIFETKLNRKEIKLLQKMSVTSVRNFLDLDLEQLLSEKKIDAKTYIRLNSWQKYYRKKLIR